MPLKECFQRELVQGRSPTRARTRSVAHASSYKVGRPRELVQGRSPTRARTRADVGRHSGGLAGRCGAAATARRAAGLPAQATRRAARRRRGWESTESSGLSMFRRQSVGGTVPVAPDDRKCFRCPALRACGSDGVPSTCTMPVTCFMC